MIFDSIENLYLYEKDIPSLSTVSNILKNENLLEKNEGSYTTDDPNCRYNICVYNTCEEHKNFEIHKKEMDVQITQADSSVWIRTRTRSPPQGSG